MRARARARALADHSDLNCRALREVDFFFSFRTRARGVSRWAFSCRPRASAHARSLPSLGSVFPARGWGTNRCVGGVLPQHPQGRTF